MLSSIKLDGITGNAVAAAHGAYQTAHSSSSQPKKQQQAGGSHYYDIPGSHHAYDDFRRRERYTTSLGSSLKSPALFNYHPPSLQGIDSHTSHPKGKPMMAAGALNVLSHHDDKSAHHALAGHRTSPAHGGDASNYISQQLAKHVKKDRFYARRERMSIPTRLDEQRENFNVPMQYRGFNAPVQKTVVSHSPDGTKDDNPTLKDIQYTVMARSMPTPCNTNLD